MEKQLSILPLENVRFGVDMVKVELAHIKPYDFNNFMVGTEYLREKIWIGTKVTDYRYNLVYQDDDINPSETTVFIGYDHNAASLRGTEKKSLQMRFNPAKLNYLGSFWRWFRRLVAKCNYKVALKEMDCAFDMPYPMPDVYVDSLTGKEKSMYKGTEYWGQRHSDGYCKKYNKAKEQQSEETLTRVEVTLKDSVDSADMLFSDLMRPSINKYYRVTVLRCLYDQSGGKNLNLKAVALGLLHGYIQKEELTSRRKGQVKEYIQDNFIELDLDKVVMREWQKQLEYVKNFLFEEIFLQQKEEIGAFCRINLQ